MQRRFIGLIGLTILAAYGCGSGSNSGSSPGGGTFGGSGGGTLGNGGAPGQGGNSSVGGDTQPGDSSNCPNVTPCGGSVVGTWDVSSSCLKISGDYDVPLGSMGCTSLPATGSLRTTGTWIASSDGTYTDNTLTTGTITLSLSAKCLTVSSVPVECDRMSDLIPALGWASATCATTNGQCNCTATANQHGGLGLVAPSVETSGYYTSANNTLTTDDTLKYSYCVSGSGSTLNVTPQLGSLAGTIVLQKSGTIVGSGGAPSTGGASFGGQQGTTGGKSGAGGTSATGGVTGAGGAPTGGKSGTGGAFTGGSMGTGGLATGGRTGVGGGATGGSSPVGGSGTKTSTGGITSATGGKSAAGGGTSTGTSQGPCDIYAAANCPCVAAHSSIRALLSTYSGALYQVKRASDSKTTDIPLGAGGFADSSVQDAFCTGTTCTIIRIYDQSGHGNFLEAETPDSTVGGYSLQTAAKATAESLTVSGHRVYSIYTTQSQAFWHDGSKSGMPLGASPQGIYMVTSGKHYNNMCCYDYGNGETGRAYVQGPSMDSIYFGSCKNWGKGAGNGPWIMADMEDGMVAGASNPSNNNPTQTATYITAVEKNNGTTEWALRGGDATTGALTTYYKGALPAGKNPMKKQGSIVLGSGGDCCLTNNTLSEGTFYEGAIVAGYPSDAAEDAVQANIASAGYGK